jgi:nitroreductase
LVAEVAKCGQQLDMNPFLSKAGAVIIILEEHAVLAPRIRRLFDSQAFAKGDLGAATVQVCLEAESQGIGSCIIGIYDRDTLAKLLDVPAEKHFAALIALGYAADAAVRPKVRKDLKDIARFV